jgi:hypothetical protein
MENNKRTSQVKKAIAYLQAHGSITSREAFIELGIMSFPKRICEMKDYGVITGYVWENGVREDGSKYRVKRYHIVAMPEEVAT